LVTGEDLIDELDRLAEQRSYPAVLLRPRPRARPHRDGRLAGERVGLSFIPPGEPCRNGYVESFNSRVRDEFLNINIFGSRAHARVVITDLKED
jgi:transposase InsO family protein